MNITKNIRFTDTESKLVVTSGQMGKGNYEGRGNKRYKLLCVLHNTGNMTKFCNNCKCGVFFNKFIKKNELNFNVKKRSLYHSFTYHA